MSDIMEGLRNQYLTYPWQVIKPFANFVRGQVIKAKSVDERGDTYVITFENNSTLKMKVFDKYLRPHDVNSNIGAPELMNGKSLIDKTDPKFKDIESVTDTNKVREFPDENNPKQFKMRNTPQVKPQPKKPDNSYFEKFNSKERVLNFDIKVKLPSLTLLKAMNEDAIDNKEFTKELAEYIYSSITTDLIVKSVNKLLKNNNENA